MAGREAPCNPGSTTGAAGRRSHILDVVQKARSLLIDKRPRPCRALRAGLIVQNPQMVEADFPSVGLAEANVLRGLPAHLKHRPHLWVECPHATSQGPELVLVPGVEVAGHGASARPGDTHPGNRFLADDVAEFFQQLR